MNRAVQAFVDSGMAEQIIGSPENHELKQLAYIKAVRSKLQLQQIYGLGDLISLNDGSQVQLHHVLLASELTSVFFQKEFIQPFQDHFHESGVLAQALCRLAMDGVISGGNRFPMTWSEEQERSAGSPAGLSARNIRKAAPIRPRQSSRSGPATSRRYHSN
jgi:hypothetical protein